MSWMVSGIQCTRQPGWHRGQFHQAPAVAVELAVGFREPGTCRHDQRRTPDARPVFGGWVVPHRAQNLRLVAGTQYVVYLPVALEYHGLHDTLDLAVPADLELAADARQELGARARNVARRKPAAEIFPGSARHHLRTDEAAVYQYQGLDALGEVCGRADGDVAAPGMPEQDGLLDAENVEQPTASDASEGQS